MTGNDLSLLIWRAAVAAEKGEPIEAAEASRACGSSAAEKRRSIGNKPAPAGHRRRIRRGRAAGTASRA